MAEGSGPAGMDLILQRGNAPFCAALSTFNF
jgi:hypothetical protein